MRWALLLVAVTACGSSTQGQNDASTDGATSDGATDGNANDASVDGNVDEEVRCIARPASR